MYFCVSLTTAVLHSDARKQHGTSDPFVKFVVGSKLVHKTKTVKGELNPVWDEVFVVVLAELASPLEVKVYSQNLVKDDLLGQHSLDLRCLPQNRALETSLPLQPLTDSHLQLSLNLVCLPASDSQSLHHLQSSPARRRKASGEGKHSGVLSVGLVEGRQVGQHNKLADHEIYCKFRYLSFSPDQRHFYLPGWDQRAVGVKRPSGSQVRGGWSSWSSTFRMLEPSRNWRSN